MRFRGIQGLPCLSFLFPESIIRAGVAGNKRGGLAPSLYLARLFRHHRITIITAHRGQFRPPFRGLLVLVAFPVLLAGTVRAGYLYPWEGFEREINWEPQNGTAATGREVDAEHFTEGGHSLKLLFESVAQSGRAVYNRVQTMDWSPFGAMLVDVYNPTDIAGLRLGVVLTTTDRWISYEYITPPLQKGWNRDVRVDLLAPLFSSGSSDYRPVDYLAGRGEVKMVGFEVYPGEAAEGEVEVDNVRLERSGLATLGNFTLNTTVEATGSAGRIDYIPPGMRLRGGDLAAVESFEAGAGWTTEAPGVVISPATDHVSHGRAALGVTFPAEPDGFSVVMAGMESRLAGARQLQLDVYNPGQSAEIALELEDNEGETHTHERVWIWHGWSTLVFDFTNQGQWSGEKITERILSNLAEVRLIIASRMPGRLMFDGVSASAISLRGAATTAVTPSLSWNPTPELEMVVDARVEDTFYGSRASHVHDAGTEAYLNSAGLRWDAGDFRSGLLYRRKVTAFDNPIMSLVSPDNLGNNVAAGEAAGRFGETAIQGLAASRLEFASYNGRAPTGLGPENLVGLRARRDLDGDTRLGLTAVAHQNRYPASQGGIPRNRQLLGVDAESHLEGEGRALTAAAEGAVTVGDRRSVEVEGAPAGDRGYYAVKLEPEWDRLKGEWEYEMVGYDFDADFSSWGGNWEGYMAGVNFNLEGLSFLSRLSEVPIYDRTLASNLGINWSLEAWRSRDSFTDPVTGALHPRSTEFDSEVRFENDYKARPHFSLAAKWGQGEDAWTVNPDTEQYLTLRLPLPLEVVAGLSGTLKQDRQTDRITGESGTGWERILWGSLERFFPGNLFVSAGGTWVKSRESWEGEWGDEEGHFKFTASLRKTLGPSSVIQVDYGVPALYGYDFGLQDTIEILTVKGQVYF